MARLGMVADNKRNIASGSQYDSLIPRPQGVKELLQKNSDNISDTMRFMGQIIGKWYKDTANLAPLLIGTSKFQTCHNIWDFVYNHIQYSTESEEQLPRPAYTWHVKRRVGADCDDYAIFISTILLNLKINHVVRIAKYNGNTDFQHVYIVVPDASGDIIIDPVLNQFNKEENYSFKKDYTMAGLGVNIYGLKGIGETQTITNPMLAIGAKLFDAPNLSGVEDDAQRLAILEASRDTLLVIPELSPNSKELVKMYQLAIDNWDTPLRGDALMAIDAYDQGLSGNSGLGKTFIGKIFAGAVKVIKKFNPVSVLIRNAFLLCLRVNVFQQSSLLSPGYYTYEQVQPRGYTRDRWERAVKACQDLGKMYKDWGGEEKFVRAAVLHGKRVLAGFSGYLGGLGGSGWLGELGAEPISTTTAVAAASPLLLALVKILKDIGLSDGNSKALADALSKGGAAALKLITDHSEREDGTNPSEDAPTPPYVPPTAYVPPVEPAKSGMNTYLMIGLGLAAAAAVYMATSGGGKSSSGGSPQRRASPHKLSGPRKQCGPRQKKNRKAKSVVIK